MKKIKRIGTKNIKNYIKEHFSDDSFLLPEHKIDSIIKEYLSERSESLDEPYIDAYEEKTTLSPTSIELIEDMILTLTEMKSDLEIIQDKESDVLLYKEQYADEIIEYSLRDIKDFIEGLEDIIELTKGKK
jgi:hypothetical protein